MRSAESQNENEAPARRLLSRAVALILAFVPIAVGALRFSEEPAAKRPVFQTEPVKRKRFVRRVPATGELRTWRPAIVYSDCRAHEREIIELVPEGSWVEKGDIVCVLGSSELEDQLKIQQAQLIRANNGLAEALSDEALQEAHNARRLAASDLQARLAQDSLNAYEEAESVNNSSRLIMDERLKVQQQEQTRESLQHANKLTALGYQTTSELKRVESDYQRSSRAVGAVRREISMMNRFDHPRSMLELSALAANSQQELIRTGLQNQLAFSASRLTTLERRKWVAGVQAYVNYLTRAVAACTMRAPKSGEVVYCHKRDEGKFIEVGNKVHYTQNLIRIANRSTLTIAGKVSDRQVFSVKSGQPVEITIPTLPEHVFSGTLTWVAPIPAASNWFEPDVLHHKVQIVLDENSEGLADITLGATAEANIVVDDRSDVLQVPVRAVFSYDRDYAVIVEKQGQTCLRIIEVAESNGDFIEVLSGLNVDERVVIDERFALKQLASELEPR